MTGKKQEIIKNLGYTDLVYGRINHKLSTNLTNREIESFIDKILEETDEECYHKTGKNYYVINRERNIRITINSNTFSVITVDKWRNK